MALTDEQLWALVLGAQIEVEDLALAAKAAHAVATDSGRALDSQRRMDRAKEKQGRLLRQWYLRTVTMTERRPDVA
ncbi:MAG: hypothetical protein M3Y55_07945 [Pseudomonadota bacterium]|nr:hypothetical protein [Pseudomonadota bacterium]